MEARASERLARNCAQCKQALSMFTSRDGFYLRTPQQGEPECRFWGCTSDSVRRSSRVRAPAFLGALHSNSQKIHG